jgi:predicted AAA+ superfamily ATPase
LRLGCRNAWFFPREAGGALAKALGRPPAALLLGPRQCGKSTLARQLLAQRGDAVILDLQDRADRARLQEPELFFEAHRHQLVCLDEIQLLPEFFSRLRAEIDGLAVFCCWDRRPAPCCARATKAWLAASLSWSSPPFCSRRSEPS